MFYHPKAVNIHFLEPDGFKKVCDVVALKDKTWRYKNINKDLMYSDHTSWVYAIVLGKSIVKIGETGVPLGIKKSRSYEYGEEQPLKSTNNRFGRLSHHPGTTDGDIRESLFEYANTDSSKVSIWAKKCEILEQDVLIGGVVTKVKVASHKDQELMYLDLCFKIANNYPELNVGRK